MTGRDLVTTSYRELGVIDAIDPAPAELAVQGLGVLNRILDAWNAQRDAVYADVFSTFTLTPSLQPHTIGPSGATWTLGRPVSVEGVQVSTDGGTTWTPVTMRDAYWYQSRPLPAQTSAFPTDVFFNPTAANAQLYFWPVPTTAHQVKLWTRQILANLTLDSVIAVPAGYQSAMTDTLKEKLVEMPMYASLHNGAIERAASKARATAFANNVGTPRLITADAGMPSGRGGYFDYRTGVVR